MSMRSVSIVIPNYNGEQLLRENLPLLQQHTAQLGRAVEIIVVDNGSADASLEYLRSLSGVKTLVVGKNSGFGPAVNLGMQQAGHDIVYVLNNDVHVCPGFLEPLLGHFDDPDVFAVCSTEVHSCSPAAAETVFPVLVKFRLGIFWYWYEKCVHPRQAVVSFSVSAGHCAYDRRKFLRLGGFDPLLRPFYAEDGDVCWQAWKLGYSSLIEPRSCVVHAKNATIGRLYGRRGALRIHWKNRFLMTWKNLDGAGFWLKHVFFTAAGALICPCIGRPEYTLGLLLALGQLPEVLAARRKIADRPRINPDARLFRRFSRMPLCGPATVLYLHETAVRSGAENSLIQLVKGLDAQKFKPLFVLPQEGPLSQALAGLGIETVIIDFPAVRRLAGVVAAIKQLKRLALQRGVRVFHSQSIRTHFYATVVARLLDAPVVWHQRNLRTSEVIDPDRLFVRCADAVICNSASIAGRFASAGRRPPNVRIVYNGVDAQDFSPAVSGAAVRKEFNISPDAAVVGIASRFHKDKGHETFLRAAQRVSARCGEKVVFLVAGSGVFKEDEEREAQLREMARALGLEKQVVFTGFRQDMPAVFAAMDIVVLASEAEPCGRVVLEAMSSGKAVVATSSGGTPELLRDKEEGMLFAPDDCAALAGKISVLIRQPALAVELGRRARQRILERFTIEKNRAAIQEIYSGLLKDYYA